MVEGLTFDYGWRKPFNIQFQGVDTEIELVFDAYKGEDVNEKQLASYEIFSKEKAKYEAKVSVLLQEYIRNNRIQNTGVQAKSLQFNYDGSFALLCDCDWDIENGIAVVLYPNEAVTLQGNFL